MRWRSFLFVSIVCAHGFAHAAPVRSLHATASVSHASNGPTSRTDTMEFWVKNGKSRMQTGQFVVITDGKDRYSFRLNDPQKVVMLLPLPREMAGNTTLGLIRQIIPANVKRKKVGTAKLIGHSAAVYELTQPTMNGTAKLWEATDIGLPLPLRLEMTSSVGKETVEMKRVEVNPSLRDSLFTAPAGYRKMRVPARPPLPEEARGKSR